MTGWETYIEDVALPRKGQRVFVWGAGNTAKLAHEGMKREGLYDALGIEGFVDRALAGQAFFGFPVGHPDALPRDAFVLICTANQAVLLEIDATLNRMGRTGRSARPDRGGGGTDRRRRRLRRGRRRLPRGRRR